jgi:hypothetical protein
MTGKFCGTRGRGSAGSLVLIGERAALLKAHLQGTVSPRSTTPDASAMPRGPWASAAGTGQAEEVTGEAAAEHRAARLRAAPVRQPSRAKRRRHPRSPRAAAARRRLRAHATRPRAQRDRPRQLRPRAAAVRFTAAAARVTAFSSRNAASPWARCLAASRKRMLRSHVHLALAARAAVGALGGASHKMQNAPSSTHTCEYL